jgi:hypothetical protein
MTAAVRQQIAVGFIQANECRINAIHARAGHQPYKQFSHVEIAAGV